MQAMARTTGQRQYVRELFGVMAAEGAVGAML
jgi:hypothetical protein